MTINTKGYPAGTLTPTIREAKVGDIRKCKECDVYKKHGKEKPIVVFDEKILNRLLLK